MVLKLIHHINPAMVMGTVRAPSLLAPMVSMAQCIHVSEPGMEQSLTASPTEDMRLLGATFQTASGTVLCSYLAGDRYCGSKQSHLASCCADLHGTCNYCMNCCSIPQCSFCRAQGLSFRLALHAGACLPQDMLSIACALHTCLSSTLDLARYHCSK